jgi:hypothetical protein
LSPQHPIEVWDNDGIVNTLSMFWPLGENLVVQADHMDIVGHYTPVLADRGSGRKYRAYDLLKSDSGFDNGKFQNIWSEIFAFALGRPHVGRARAARAALAKALVARIRFCGVRDYSNPDRASLGI